MKSVKWLFSLLLLVAPSILSAQSTPKEVPFFFPKGIYQTTDPLQQRVEYSKIFQSTWLCNQGNPHSMTNLIPGSQSIKVVTDVASTSSVTEPNGKLTVILDHFYRMPDGRIRVTTLCGQDYITDEQLKVVSDSISQLTVAAATRNNAFYQKILDKSVSDRALKLGIKREELVAQLDEKVPGYDITFRELHRLPKPSKVSDFVPRELHLGYNPPLGGILGVTWLNTGVVYYNPEAWMVDYVLTVPVIMQHEEVHVNKNVEKFPMSEAFDVELMADMPIVLYPENTVNFQTHGYASDLREFAEIYFGFDWDQYQQDVVTYNFEGNVVYNDKNYVTYYNQLAQIKAEMLRFFEEVTIPEFYSDPTWWSAVNDIRGDNNSVFRMTLSTHYHPVVLGSAAKTEDFISEHQDEIKDITQRAFNAGMGGGKQGGMAMTQVPPYLLEEYQRAFSAEERDRIETFFRQHPEKLKELQTMSPADVIQFLGTFKSSSLKGVAK